MITITKYPRTVHLAGSRLQSGDSVQGQVSIKTLLSSGCSLVWEEKLDGANVGISFQDGVMYLQCRGHYLQGGARERQFDLFKRWASAHEEELYLIIGDRYVMYGEWLYARHSSFYDALPHFFMEFDILDRETGEFLSTPERHAMLAGSTVVSVPVLPTERWIDAETGGIVPGTSEVRTDADVRRLVRNSIYKTAQWEATLAAAATLAGVAPDAALGEGHRSRLAEGVYLKVEKAGLTVARYKWIHPSFTQAIVDDGVHWAQRPLIVNRLSQGVDLFLAQDVPPEVSP